MSSYKPLLDLAKLINEPIESFDGEKIYYATGDINENSETEITKVTFRDKPSRANLTSKQGDVIFARMQATKKVRITSKDDEESIFSTGFAILRPSKFLDSRFLFHYLNSDIFQKAKDRLCSGSTQKAINNQKLAEIDIPYFDVSTQQKIAAILDKADSLRQKDKQLLRLFENLIDSVFNERFKNESNLVPLSDLCTKITDGVHARPVYTETGIPFISVKNVTTKKLEFKNCQFISEKDHQNFVKRCNPELDDILYTKVGATYGRGSDCKYKM
jgi:type I restriction enzyme S subunit